MSEPDHQVADMITLLELQTAVEVAAKVAARVESVGRRVIQLGEAEKYRPKIWRFIGWGIRRNWQDEPQSDTVVTANFYCMHGSRPITERYGDPEMDEYSEITTDETFKRHVSFPYRYLITEGWEEEILEKKLSRDAWLLAYRLKDREEKLRQDQADLLESWAKLEEDKNQHAANVAAGIVEQTV